MQAAGHPGAEPIDCRPPRVAHPALNQGPHDGYPTLYTLIAIADCGSFAEAGNRIGLSLSAVSMQVRALEEELEIAIFDRSRRPPVLTDAGLALVTARAT